MCQNKKLDCLNPTSTQLLQLFIYLFPGLPGSDYTGCGNSENFVSFRSIEHKIKPIFLEEMGRKCTYGALTVHQLCLSYKRVQNLVIARKLSQVNYKNFLGSKKP